MIRLSIAADCMKRAADCQARGEHSDAVCWLRLSVGLRRGRVESIAELEVLGQALEGLDPTGGAARALTEGEQIATSFARKYIQQMAVTLARQQPL